LSFIVTICRPRLCNSGFFPFFLSALSRGQSGRAQASASRTGITAQLPPARLHYSEAARPRRDRRSRQRPLRRRRRRNRQTRATQTSRRSHVAASAHRHLDSFAPACSASRPSRLILFSQQIQVYAQGVKANVLFFDRKPAAEKPWTDKLWIYDLRTNKHFTLKENPLKRSDLDDFVACYNPKNRHERKESERFKGFTYEELLKRDKLNLDIFWLKDESLEDSANLPDPDIIAAEIVEDLQAALAQFAEIASDLKK
jgi:hypothetical protein